jgi:hypothetical protein
VLSAAKEVYTNSPFFRAQDPAEMKKAFYSMCRGAMEGYFSGLTDRKHAVDKNRAWSVKRAFLNEIYPNPKILWVFPRLRIGMSRNMKKDSEEQVSQACADFRA